MQRYCSIVGVYYITIIKTLQLLHFPMKVGHTLDLIIHVSSWTNSVGSCFRNEPNFAAVTNVKEQFVNWIYKYKSYCSTVNFCRITSIYQPTNAHIISHKTLLNHFKTHRHVQPCQIIIRELCFLLKLCYSIHNSFRICKRGVVAAYHVVWECVVEQWLSVRRTTHT